MWSQRSKDCEIHKVLQQQRSRLAIPWQCPEEGYGFMTEVKRAWAAHLLRTHHLLFRGRGKAPCPLEGQELQDRLEAFRCCNRGSKQRARENHRVMTQPRSWSIADSSPMWILGGRFGSRPRPWSGGRLGRGWAALKLLLDEDLEQAMASLEDHNNWQLVPDTPPPADMDELLLRGIPISEFAAKVLS